SAYRITAATTAPTAGASDALTITLVDSYQNVETGFSGAKILSFTGLGTSPNGTAPTVTNMNGSPIVLGAATTLTFTGGVLSAGGILTATKAETATLNASSNSGPLTTSSPAGASVNLTVAAASPASLAFGLQPTDTVAGQHINSSTGVTVRILDTY